jgi:hypothetical protein
MSRTTEGFQLNLTLFGLAGSRLLVTRRRGAAVATLSLYIYKFAVHLSISVLD